jgi:multicomponent Na+:H+ antiporter subunit C
MEIELAVIIWILFTAGFYLILRRSIVKLLLGLVLLSHAANMLIFASAGITRGRAPLVPKDAVAMEGAYADPLPQALILTAIVISFGVIAFAMVLFERAYKVIGTDDLDSMTETDT